MAKSATTRDVSDSESDDARPVASKKGATSGASKSNGHGATEQDEGGDDDESGEEEEEFEIELIIDHQRGMFQEVRAVSQCRSSTRSNASTTRDFRVAQVTSSSGRDTRRMITAGSTRGTLCESLPLLCCF